MLSLPFPILVPYPWLLKPKLNEHAVKNLMIIPGDDSIAHEKITKETEGIKRKVQVACSNHYITRSCIKFSYKIDTFTQGRICWIASWGLKIRQNLVTFPAAAMRTSASLSRRSLTYAGTKSALKQPEVKKDEISCKSSYMVKTIWKRRATSYLTLL